MRTGKLSENRLKRAVLKKIEYKSSALVLGPSVGRDCSRIRLGETDDMVFAANPVSGPAERLGTKAFYRMANDIVCAGAVPAGMLVQIFLPEGCKEDVCKSIMAEIATLASEYQVDILGGHTEVMATVSEPLLSVTGVGRVKPGVQLDSSGLQPGMDIVMTKWAGAPAASELARVEQEKLRTRLSRDFLERAEKYSAYISCIRDAEIAAKAGAGALHNVSENGVFGALWEMAEASGVGLEIRLKDIPIRQETVEICELFDMNPYMAASEGVLLAGTTDGPGLVRMYEDAGICAAVIGQVSGNNDRVVCNGEERRFLVPPGNG